ncbi:MAG TPA: hypothetical protein VK843_04420 [Planctomycetota bacterium]|nr:hypothetical protein [Planctomycetota bacterium]
MAGVDSRFHHPIIYVRGYAMTRGEMDDTAADPFCGFNLGSTTYRATPNKSEPARKFIFESPVVRLQSDFGYSDVYEDGVDVMDPDWDKPLKRRSIVIFRYYDQASALLGDKKTPNIEDFAKQLNELVLKVRKLVVANLENAVSAEEFRCYLVAHSMGGLVCRAFLQNPKLGSAEARASIDKVFTYATPHNGIEMAGINVPEWMKFDDMSNFNHETMADYLNIKALFKKTKRVDWLPEESFPSKRFFCMVGTNRNDYGTAAGLSRTFAGHGSDGLVKIENASVWGVDAKGKFSAPCATAYAYRSHSGFFGIVNGEDSYQNLVRFLFGDVRIDIWLEIDKVELPDELRPLAKEGTPVNALYQFEVTASARGKRWYLTRRVAEEDSSACRSHADLVDPAKLDKRRIYLSTIFLGTRWKVDKARPTLAYSLKLGVRVPDYEVERRFWPDRHFEGGYLFHDAVIIELIPPEAEGGDWEVQYDWQSDNNGLATQPLLAKELKTGAVELTIPFSSENPMRKESPSIQGKLRFVASLWNQEE